MKSVLSYISESFGSLRNYANSTLPVLYKWNNKAWMIAYLLTIWFTGYFKPTVVAYSSGKKSSFEILFLVYKE